MNNDSATSTSLPGHLIHAIALSTGIHEVDAALAVAAVLGGIAGPEARLIGPGGESVHPGINLVVAGTHPRWLRAQELLLTPVEDCQRVLRDLSAGLVPEQLERIQHPSCPLDNTTEVIVERSAAGIFADSLEPRHQFKQRHFGALRHPVFLLRSPDPDTFSKGIPEVMDQHPLVYYPDGLLLNELLARRPGKAWASHGTRLAQAIAGQERVIPSKQIGGTIQAQKAWIMMTGTRDQVVQILTGRHPELVRLLQRCIIFPPETGANDFVPDFGGVQSGYRSYLATIQNLLDARRDTGGCGISWRTMQRNQLELHYLIHEVCDWLAARPKHLQPYYGFAPFLPQKLCWAFLMTAMGESTDWVMPFTRYVTEQVLKRQTEFLTSVFDSVEAEKREKAQLVMLKKLAEKPCLFRDLTRRYSVQSRDLHEPVLMELVNAGCVNLRQDGLIEISAQGLKRVAA